MLMAVCNPDVAPMAVHGTIDSMDPCKQNSNMLTLLAFLFFLIVILLLN